MENNNYGSAQQAQPRIERYDPIRHIDELIDIVRDAGGVPFTDKCAIDRGDMIASLRVMTSLHVLRTLSVRPVRRTRRSSMRLTACTP